MKKILLFTTAIVLLAFSFSSCKKKDKETTAVKIQHQWTIVNYIDNNHDAGGDNIETTNPTSGDFINFSSDGTANFQLDGATGTSSYSLIGDTQILLGTETYTIKTLTDTQLTLYSKDVISSTEFEEFTVNMIR
jgi:hypothetical protein